MGNHILLCQGPNNTHLSLLISLCSMLRLFLSLALESILQNSSSEYSQKYESKFGGLKYCS